MKQRLSILVLTAVLAVSCEQDTVRRVDYAIQGIDVSHYQSRINWSTVAEQGMHFAFVKATEGATHSDSLFCENWDAIREAGLRRGAYHFFRPRTPADEQAANFINWVEMEQGDLPPVIDVEVIDGVSNEHLVANLQTCLFLIELHFGIKPIIYSNVKFYNRHLAGKFSDYPLWIARYNDRSPTLACGSNWHFWQYGNRGLLEGVDGYVDFNVFSGDWEDLNRISMQPESAVLSAAPTFGFLAN